MSVFVLRKYHLNKRTFNEKQITYQESMVLVIISKSHFSYHNRNLCFKLKKSCCFPLNVYKARALFAAPGCVSRDTERRMASRRRWFGRRENSVAFVVYGPGIHPISRALSFANPTNPACLSRTDSPGSATQKRSNENFLAKVQWFRGHRKEIDVARNKGRGIRKKYLIFRILNFHVRKKKLYIEFKEPVWNCASREIFPKNSLIPGYVIPRNFLVVYGFWKTSNFNTKWQCKLIFLSN